MNWHVLYLNYLKGRSAFDDEIKEKRAKAIKEQIPPTTVLLELLPSDANIADLALITAIGTEVAAHLRDQGDIVQPVYSEQRGGELLLQIISGVWANKDSILSDLSS